jgi:hypothetical protein
MYFDNAEANSPNKHLSPIPNLFQRSFDLSRAKNTSVPKL